MQCAALVMMLTTVRVSSAAQAKPLSAPEKGVARDSSSFSAGNPATPTKEKDATQLLVVVGIIQAAILGGTILAIIRQTNALTNSERAWVIVDADRNVRQIKDETGQAITLLNFLVWNAGKTPAKITYTVSELKIIKSLKELPDEPSYGNPGTHGNSMLAPVGIPGQGDSDFEVIPIKIPKLI
jgi:hypothetical protein